MNPECRGGGRRGSRIRNGLKLLMNIAVSERAEEGKSFASYVRYLADEGHITANAKGWVGHIKYKGN